MYTANINHTNLKEIYFKHAPLTKIKGNSTYDDLQKSSVNKISTQSVYPET